MGGMHRSGDKARLMSLIALEHGWVPQEGSCESRHAGAQTMTVYCRRLAALSVQTGLVLGCAMINEDGVNYDGMAGTCKHA